MKASFFITYIMVDGWAGIAGEILRLKPLIFYHLKNFFLVKTEKDREEAMDPGSVGFNTGEPQIQLYFLLGLVYAVVTPFLLPFILVFFGLAYVVYRHQVRLLSSFLCLYLSLCLLFRTCGALLHHIVFKYYKLAESSCYRPQFFSKTEFNDVILSLGF